MDGSLFVFLDGFLCFATHPEIPTLLVQFLAKARFDELYPEDHDMATNAFAAFMGLFGQVRLDVWSKTSRGIFLDLNSSLERHVNRSRTGFRSCFPCSEPAS